MSAHRARVALVTTGGTIASVSAERSAPPKAALGVQDLLRPLAADPHYEIVHSVEAANLNSWNMSIPQMLDVARAVQACVSRTGIDGVVVTHGTDTLEETAFFVDAALATPKPIVFTGAMRTADARDPDGPANLQDALRAAAAPDLWDTGASVCMAGEIHAARSVRKVHTRRLDALASPGDSLLARVGPTGVVRVHQAALPGWTFRGVLESWPSPQVPLIYPYTGISTAVIEALVAATEPEGVVMGGFGLGHFAGDAVEPLLRLVDRGVVVVMATRVLGGGASPVYGGAGGGLHLRDAGVLSAGTLPPEKARLLLMLCLAEGTPARAGERFTEAIRKLGRDVPQGEA